MPYFSALFLVGIPMAVMEFALGQIFQSGVVGVFQRIHPRAAGVGWAASVASMLISIFYMMLLCWVAIYLVSSFIVPLPWSTTAPDVFFHRDVLEMDLSHISPQELAQGDLQALHNLAEIFSELCDILMVRVDERDTQMRAPPGAAAASRPTWTS